MTDQTQPVSAADLRNELSRHYGSETMFRHSLVRAFNYTEGVQCFLRKAEAYWFVDIAATEGFALMKKHEFILVKLVSAGSASAVFFEDGNGKELGRHSLTFCSTPEGTWEFFLENNVLCLPSER